PLGTESVLTEITLGAAGRFAAFDDLVTLTVRAADGDERHGPFLPMRSYEDEAQCDIYLSPSPLLKHYQRVVVHGVFRLFHDHLLWNSSPGPHRQPFPAYILTERYVGIVSARCVKGASSIHPGHTSLQSPTARPTHHDRMDRPIHSPGLRGLSPWS